MSEEDKIFFRVRQIDPKFRLPKSQKTFESFPKVEKFPRSRHYFTSGHGRKYRETENIEQSAFSLIPDTHLFAHSQFRKNRKRQSSKEKWKPGHRISDVLRRLHIEETECSEEKKPGEETTLSNIDPEYFLQLKSRSGKERLCRQSYLNDTKEILRNELLTRKIKNKCLEIDREMALGEENFRKAEEELERKKQEFDELLEKNYSETEKIFNEANEEISGTKKMKENLEKLSREFVQNNVEVVDLMVDCQDINKCHRFLQEVRFSEVWRKRHSIVKSENFDDKILENSRNVVRNSMDCLLEALEKDVESKARELDFKDPYDLLQVFREIEERNFDEFSYLESLDSSITDIANFMKEIQAQANREIGEVEKSIKALEDKITIEKEQAEIAEQNAKKFLHGTFRDLVSSDAILRLKIFIEDTFEACFGSAEKTDYLSMMKQIEELYQRLNAELDNFPPQLVKACKKEDYLQEAKKMKERKEEMMKYERMQRLIASLKRAMEPTEPKKRQLMWRSRPITRKIKKVEVEPELTEEEKDQLMFFSK